MPKRILIVDDEPGIRKIVQISLKVIANWDVLEAASGADGLAIAQAEQPDAILLDVMMPGMDGFEVTQHIRHNLELPYIPILLVTGYSELSASEGLSRGADGFIHKPIDFDLLLARIQEIFYYSSR